MSDQISKLSWHQEQDNFRQQYFVYSEINFFRLKNPKFPFRTPERTMSLFTHINWTHTQTYHTIYVDSCTDILYYCTQLVNMTCSSVNPHKTNTHKHMDVKHHLYYILSKWVHTLSLAQLYLHLYFVITVHALSLSQLQHCTDEVYTCIGRTCPLQLYTP